MIQRHTAAIQTGVSALIDARKAANKIEGERTKAICYHDTVAVCFDEIRRHIDKLEEIRRRPDLASAQVPRTAVPALTGNQAAKGAV